MITLVDSPFSPFARKVRLVLEYKKLVFETVDALSQEQHSTLLQVNPRKEVPALVDNDLVVTNSADIVSYLEHRYPDSPVYPKEASARVMARKWERSADTFLDAILVNISYWSWAIRSDKMPAGLLAKAKEDLELLYQRMEQTLSGKDYLCGELCIADFAMFVQLSSVRALNVAYDKKTYPNLVSWFKRLRDIQLFQEDLRRTAIYISDLANQGLERQKIFWRGDRIEWMLSRGFHKWFNNEIESGNVLWPGREIPPID